MRTPKKPKPEQAAPRWRFHRIAPRLLVKGAEDERGRFFLALALAFNDLRGLSYLSTLAKEDGARPAGEMSPEAGDQNGVQLQITRYAAALLHELCELLKAHSQIVDSVELRRLAGRLPTGAQASWRAISDVALGRGTEAADNVRTLLARVRDNLTYHYYKPKDLSLGFERHFFRTTTTGHNDAARISLGETMMVTRFFYADGAAQAGLLRWAELNRIEDAAREIGKLSDLVNVALRYLIEAFIDERQRAAGRKPRSRPNPRRG